VRENGGQYTHAALWTVLATTLRGDGDRAFELFQLINPFSHAGTLTETTTYKVEPYVVAADVYSAERHVGRGGWTWYTGSAAWMYRVGLESILGFTLRGDHLAIDPCIPGDWDGFSLEYRHGSTTYEIEVRNNGGAGSGVREVMVDGHLEETRRIPLTDDGERHAVIIEMGELGP
jgi:cyclic beta-1,2-glucan synthetase